MESYIKMLSMHKPLPYLLVLGVVLSLLPSGLAQSKGLPRFEDYPVTGVFNGKPGAPKIGNEIKDKDAEEIKEAYSYEKHPNFAGRFVVIDWACGSPCKTMAMVDAKTGDVFVPPITWGEGLNNPKSFYLPVLTYPGDVSQNPELEYRLDSKLFIIKCNEGNKESPYTFYFLWQGNRWELLRKAALPKTREMN
jgi:hypothetical protein